MKTRKELKEAFKEQKQVMGVYQILNKVNGKMLIDASTNIPAKWNRHQTELRFGSHRNKQLQKDWNDIGVDNFVFSILSELELDEAQNVNAHKEVKLLKEMVLEEMNIEQGMKY